MSWLALAYEYAGDSQGVPECAALADVGGAAWAVENPNVRKVFASIAGTYVELATGADPDFDATGLTRFHFDRCDAAGGGGGGAAACKLSSLLGPSQAPGISGNFAAAAAAAAAGAGAGAAPFVGGLATGLVWSLASDAPGAPRRSLANATYATVLASITRAAPTNSPATGLAFTTQYVLWQEGVLVQESYGLPASGGIVNVTASLTFPGAAALLGLLAGAAAEAGAEVAAGGARAVFYTPPACPAAAAAVRAGDLAALLRAAPLAAAAAPARPQAAPPALRSFGVSFPVMRFDGTTNYSVAAPGVWGEDALLVQLPASAARGAGEGALVFRVTPAPGHALQWTYASDTLLPSRNGLLSPVYAELAPQSDTPVLSYSLEVVPWQSGLE